MITSEEKHNFIRGSEIFHDLNETQISSVSQFINEAHYDVGHEVLQQGKHSSWLYIIKSGEFQILVTLPGDSKKQLTRLKENDFFGEVALLSSYPVTATVKATKASTCYILSKEVLNMFRISDPEIAYKIEHSIATLSTRRISSLIDRIYALLSQVQHIEMQKFFCEMLPDKNARAEEIGIAKLNTQRFSKMKSFHGLSKKALPTMLPYLKVIQFDKGFEIIPEMFNMSFIGVVYSGGIQMRINYETLFVKTLALAGPGELFGSNYFFSPKGHRHRMNAFAREKTIALIMDEDNIKNMMKDHKEIWQKMHHTLCDHAVDFIYAINRQLIRLESEYGNILYSERSI